MKKILFFFLLCLALNSSAQTISRSNLHKVESYRWDAYLALHDTYYGNVTYKEGSGVTISRLTLSDGKYNMRVSNYGNINDFGIASERGATEGPAFWRGLALQISEYGPSYASKGLFTQGTTSKNNKVSQVYEFKAKDPQAFLNAFKTFLNENKEAIKDRWVNLSQFTVASLNGASHSVTIAGENWSELERLRHALETNVKSYQKFLQDRGEVVDTRNYLVERVRHYNNTRIKEGTTRD